MVVKENGKDKTRETIKTIEMRRKNKIFTLFSSKQKTLSIYSYFPVSFFQLEPTPENSFWHLKIICLLRSLNIIPN
jgi:hypothetical protein